MRKIMIILTIVTMFTVPVRGETFEAPPVPESGQPYFPENPESFLDGVMEILRDVSGVIAPSLSEAVKTCISIICICILISLLHSVQTDKSKITNIAASASVAVLLLRSSGSFIELAISTIHELSQYGKLLLPVMTASVAAQGGVTSSTALYTGTAIFDTLLSSLISTLLIPLIYVTIALSVANSIVNDESILTLGNNTKGFMVWLLKILLYVFTGYMSITGVISGTVDATSLKAAKLTISGMVPVVGGILSDASETILVSAGFMKNAAGIYGMLAMLSVFAAPFMKIGVQYILLKLTTSVCSGFAEKNITSLLNGFTGCLGLLLAMTGTVCLLFMISTICFMKGVPI